jgi:GntR family transcriptional regulator / MocR family aminotransferase
MWCTLDGQGPLQQQLYRSVRTLILAGRLRPGSRVPSTRTLATDLALSRNTVLSAFEQLMSEGYLTTRHGSGTFVAQELPDLSPRTIRPPLPIANGAGRPQQSTKRESPTPLNLHTERLFAWAVQAGSLPYDFRLGRSSLVDFPQATWARLATRCARRTAVRDLDYPAAEGVLALREEIAGYLADARGVSCMAQDILIVNGIQQALDLTTRILLPPGSTVALEDPHYPPARMVFTAANVDVVGIPVDEQGIKVETLLKKGAAARLVYVTPSHQFPTGVVMSLPRRLALLDWAERNEAYIFEDDYDGEFRYVGRPLQALQGIDRAGRVLYAGTFSKTLFPALRLGYLVLPPPLMQLFRRTKALMDAGTPVFEQRVLTEFFHEGYFERHVRRSRMVYAARRTVLLDALHQHLSEAQVSGTEAGLHVMIHLPWLTTAELPDVLQRARTAGVGAYPATPCYLAPPRQATLMLGYSGLTERAIRIGIQRLAVNFNAIPPKWNDRSVPRGGAYAGNLSNSGSS